MLDPIHKLVYLFVFFSSSDYYVLKSTRNLTKLFFNSCDINMLNFFKINNESYIQRLYNDLGCVESNYHFVLRNSQDLSGSG